MSAVPSHERRLALIGLALGSLCVPAVAGPQQLFPGRLLSLGGGLPGDFSPGHLAVGDVDGDGDQDLVSARYPAGPVVVFRNDGAGEFTAQRGPALVHQGIPAAPPRPELADLNGDGTLDLVVARASSYEVLRGRGAGVFDAPVAYPSGAGAHAIAVGDVDGDGDPDVMGSGYYVLGVDLLRNRGDGTFAPVERVSNTSAHGEPTLVDLDQDGDLDLVAAGPSEPLDPVTPLATVYWNRGDGTFDARPLERGVPSGHTVVGDVDEDGRPDVVVAGSAVMAARVLRNLGGGLFAPPLPIGDARACGAELVDLDGDGHLDLVGTCFPFATVQSGVGDGTFRPVEAVLIASTGPFTFVDLDGDSRVEVVATVFGGLQVLERTATGRLVRAALVTPGLEVDVAITRDFDLDGDLDLLAAGASAPNVVFGANPGNGTFSTWTTVMTCGSPTALVPGDVDGDGDEDVIVGCQTGEATLLRGSAAGLAGEPLPTLTEGFLRAALGDLDGDGDVDALLATSSSRVVWQANDGSGGFAPPQAIPLGGPLGTVAQLALADADGDGDQDVFVAASAGGRLVENVGGGVFLPAQDLPLVGALRDLEVGDLDGDGDLDVAAIAEGETFVVWNDSGLYVDATRLRDRDGHWPVKLALADADGDGLLDVALQHHHRPISVHRSLGSRSFAAAQRFAFEVGGSGSRAFLLGDLDGDADADLVVGKGLQLVIAPGLSR